MTHTYNRNHMKMMASIRNSYLLIVYDIITDEDNIAYGSLFICSEDSIVYSMEWKAGTP